MVIDTLEHAVLDGRYEIRGLIGGGGMGLVYRARQRGMITRDVAVKVLRVDFSSDEAALERFQHEARIVANLRHPNTVKLFDAGYTHDRRPYVVTELLKGRSLDQSIARGPLPADKVLRYAMQAAGSLREAHEEGIVHRDLKPANIFIEEIGSEEVLKILDFGLARDSTRLTGLTEAGYAVGTPEYMSPEQIRGEAVGPRADIYALGLTLYECLCGEPVFPFEGLHSFAIMEKHVREPPIAVHERARGRSTPKEISELVMRMLKKSPDERPASMAEVRVELGRLLRPLEASLPIAKWTEAPTLLEQNAEGFDRAALLALRAEALARKRQAESLDVHVSVNAPAVAPEVEDETLVPISGAVDISDRTRRDDSLSKGESWSSNEPTVDGE
ncbi:MAG: serine/threonine protein kinase [Deltaproteobacteria bacterium]|nr:serine/threonine protein kinase [Deltaproteobacteria bacterium]